MTASDPAFPFSALNHQEIIQKKKIYFYKDIYSCGYIFELKPASGPDVCLWGEQYTHAMDILPLEMTDVGTAKHFGKDHSERW